MADDSIHVHYRSWEIDLWINFYLCYKLDHLKPRESIYTFYLFFSTTILDKVFYIYMYMRDKNIFKF